MLKNDRKFERGNLKYPTNSFSLPVIIYSYLNKDNYLLIGSTDNANFTKSL